MNKQSLIDYFNGCMVVYVLFGFFSLSVRILLFYFIYYFFFFIFSLIFHLLRLFYFSLLLQLLFLLLLYFCLFFLFGFLFQSFVDKRNHHKVIERVLGGRQQKLLCCAINLNCHDPAFHHVSVCDDVIFAFGDLFVCFFVLSLHVCSLFVCCQIFFIRWINLVVFNTLVVQV